MALQAIRGEDGQNVLLKNRGFADQRGLGARVRGGEHQSGDGELKSVCGHGDSARWSVRRVVGETAGSRVGSFSLGLLEQQSAPISSQSIAASPRSRQTAAACAPWSLAQKRKPV